MKINEALNHAYQQIEKLDAEVLLGFILKQSRSYLHTWPEKKLSDQDKNQFLKLIERRAQGEPVAYIIGEQEFWSLPFIVTPDTLIPRPETELLVEIILQLPLAKNFPIQVADLGTGSGAIAIALAKERPAWRFYATDISEKALAVAKKNAQRLAANNISFHQGSWCHALPDTKFEIILSNPPYIAEREWPAYAKGLMFEPRAALLSGQDGLDAIREICLQAKQYLQPLGFILLEHGFEQGEKVAEIFTKEGYQDITAIPDLSGHFRVTLSRYVPVG